MTQPALPERGIAAHRGGAATHPENTLIAFRNAVALGVHQIEFDVRVAADGQLVVIHDAAVDRTTNGWGKVAKLTLPQLRELDAGSWKAPRFVGERIPTLGEALDVLPRDVWINLQIKKNDRARAERIAEEAVANVARCDRLHQVIFACGNAAASRILKLEPRAVVCNLARQKTRADYVDHAIATRAQFIQLHHLRGEPESDVVARAQGGGLRINFFCNPDEKPDLVGLFDAGIDFVLVDDLSPALACAHARGILRLERSPS